MQPYQLLGSPRPGESSDDDGSGWFIGDGAVGGGDSAAVAAAAAGTGLAAGGATALAPLKRARSVTDSAVEVDVPSLLASPAIAAPTPAAAALPASAAAGKPRPWVPAWLRRGSDGGGTPMKPSPSRLRPRAGTGASDRIDALTLAVWRQHLVPSPIPSVAAAAGTSSSGSGGGHRPALTIMAPRARRPSAGAPARAAGTRTPALPTRAGTTGSAGSEPPLHLRPVRMRRSISFNGTTVKQYEAAAAQAVRIRTLKMQLAAAKEAARHQTNFGMVARLIVFEVLLVLGYVAYRAVACAPTLLNWQCQAKVYQQHYEDVTQLITIGGVLFATGPTLEFGLVLPALAMFIASMATFGGCGEIPFMFNSLVSTSAWQFPSLGLYAAAFVAVAAMLIYVFIISRSTYDVGVTVLVLVALAAVYSSAYVFAVASGTAMGDIVYHPHHYMIAWHICLLFRQYHDPPSVLVRWLLMGVCTQGLAAFSAASILSN